MPRVKKLDLGMTALDELFMNDKERAENKLPKIFDIPLSEIDDFPGHPYRVLDDEDMQNLMESIKDRGVITPAMVRKKDDGRYEMISGHKVNTAISTVRAAVACKKAEGYVDSGVKILIAVVIGALLLAGLYVLFNTTIMPTVTTKIQGLFNYAG